MLCCSGDGKKAEPKKAPEASLYKKKSGKRDAGTGGSKGGGKGGSASKKRRH